MEKSTDLQTKEDALKALREIYHSAERDQDRLAALDKMGKWCGWAAERGDEDWKKMPQAKLERFIREMVVPTVEEFCHSEVAEDT